MASDVPRLHQRPSAGFLYRLPRIRSVPVTVTMTVTTDGERTHRRGGHGASLAAYLRVSRERLRDDLIHVVILVGCQPPDEVNVRRGVGQRLVLRVDLGVLPARHRI